MEGWASFGKKSLPISPVTTVESDRFCIVQLQSGNNTIFIIGVYLPSSDHHIEEFSKYLADLEAAISAIQPMGSVIIAGDLNVHLTDVSPSPNSREGLVHECIHRHGLYAYSTSCYASGPKYTFSSGRANTTIDYILTESSVTSQVVSCNVYQHHSLNLSDHLPISMVFKAEANPLPPPHRDNHKPNKLGPRHRER